MENAGCINIRLKPIQDIALFAMVKLGNNPKRLGV